MTQIKLLITGEDLVGSKENAEHLLFLLHGNDEAIEEDDGEGNSYHDINSAIISCINEFLSNNQFSYTMQINNFNTMGMFIERLNGNIDFDGLLLRHAANVIKDSVGESCAVDSLEWVSRDGSFQIVVSNQAFIESGNIKLGMTSNLTITQGEDTLTTKDTHYVPYVIDGIAEPGIDPRKVFNSPGVVLG